MMGEEIKGKVAFVTGAASGVGRATALMFAARGVDVAMTDRNTEGLAETEAEMPGEARFKSYVLDLMDLDRFEPTVEAAIDDFGRIDFLVNAAGYPARRMALTEMELSAWEDAYRVNATAPMWLIKYVARDMIARGEGGRIVNVSSSASFRPHSPAAYASPKAALNQLTRSAAAELAPHDINVNAVVPGITHSNFSARAPEEKEQSAKEGHLANLFGRASHAEDVAGPIIFLCTKDSRQITGQLIHTSAGMIV